MSRIRQDTETLVESGFSADPAKCGTCAKILEERKKYRSWDTSTPAKHCCVCGKHDESVRAFHEDTPCVGDRGVRSCSECHIPMFRRRSTCEHAWAAGLRNGEKCEACELRVTGDRELGRAYMASMEAHRIAATPRTPTGGVRL